MTLQASVSGGTYDALSYAFTVVSGSGSLSGSGDSRTYNPSAGETSANIRVTVTATGDGTNATDNSSDTDEDTETFTVREAITVASINTTGREVEAAAVIERTTADTAENLYADSDRPERIPPSTVSWGSVQMRPSLALPPDCDSPNPQ